MAKPEYQYQCHECSAQVAKWVGQCPECMAWNTLQQVPSQQTSSSSTHRYSDYLVEKKEICSLDVLSCKDESPRIQTGLVELDRVLGGGLVNGSVILIGGDPGIGKSTLLMQTLARLVSLGISSLYVTAEESAKQLALRGKRLNLSSIPLSILTGNHLEQILSVICKKIAKVIVIDSIQTLFSDGMQSAPGSLSQVRECSAKLVRFAKQTNSTLFLVGHVTKDGALAGPKVLEHMVDTVLYFEGDNSSRYRIIRAVKNRYGAVNELGIFAMTDRGLGEVNNPSSIFLARQNEDVAGSIVMVTREGTRPLLVEVQALVDVSRLANPRRITIGLEQSRLAMLLALLHRHVGVSTSNQDVFVNVVGGVKVSETGADLAILLAVLSSLKNKPLAKSLVVFGEVGLSGELRPVQNGQERLKDAAKHGFKFAAIPIGNKPPKPIKGIDVHCLHQMTDMIALFEV